MVKAFRSIAVGALVALTFSPAFATTYKKLADTSLIGPDKQPVFTLAPPQMAGNQVIFMGATGTPSVYLYVVPASGGTPKVLVSNTTKVPAGSGTFTGSQAGYFSAFEPPNCAPPVAGATKAVFVGRDAAGSEGIYSVPLTGGAVKKLANYNTLIPGEPVQGYKKFNVNYSFCNLSVSGETVVFDTGAGVYSVQTDGTGLKRIADPNTPAKFPPFEVNGFAQPNIKGSQITYIGSTVFGPYAVFVGAPRPANARVLATTKPEFAEFTYPVLEDGRILFSAKLANSNQGLFSVPAAGGDRTKVVDLNTKIPPTAPGTSFSAVGSNNTSIGWTPVGGADVFAAQTTDGTNSYEGLFSRCNAKITKILAQNDKLGGIQVQPASGINFMKPVGSGGKVTGYEGVFLVGGFRYAAIYTVTIPSC